MATLKDVAKEAGVSIATVSCALSGAKAVRPETMKKINDAIEKLKYIPNYSARTLKKSSSNVIGVIMPDMKSRLYSEIFDGLSSYLQSHGYSINIAFSNGSPNTECDKIEQFITQNCAGLMLVTSQPKNTPFFQNHLLDYNIPVIFMEREPDSISVNYIGFRNYDTMYQLTKNLLEKGYRKISVVCGPTDLSPERNCIMGCRDAMQSYDLNLSPDKVCITNLTREDAFSSFLTQFSQDLPEVLISTSREITYGIQSALEYCGYRLPDDLILISYAEESWINLNQSTGVHLLSRPSMSMGETAAKILLQNIQSPNLFEQTMTELSMPETDAFARIPAQTEFLQNARTAPHHDVKIRDTIQFLAIDIPTIRSLELLSSHFTRMTGIQVVFTKVAQNELFRMISKSIEELTRSYDLYTYDVPWLEYMAQNLCLAEISGFVESGIIHKNQFFQTNLRNCQIENRYYGIPVSGGTELLFYHKDLFESRTLQEEYQRQSSLSLRPPRTWKEYNDIAAFFTRRYNPSSPTEYGTSIAGIIDEELAPELLIRVWSYGGSLWDNYHRPTFNTKENQMAFESVLKTMNYVPNQNLSMSISKTVESFCNGQTAMLITFSEYAQEISQNLKMNISGNVATHIIPGRHPASVGWNLGLNPFSSHRDSVFAFMSWLCQINTGYYMTVLNGASPMIAPYHNYELQKLYPWLKYTEESLTYATRRNPPYRKKNLILPINEIEQILCQAFRRVVNEGISIPDSLSQAQREADHLFQMYGYPIIHDIFQKH